MNIHEVFLRLMAGLYILAGLNHFRVPDFYLPMIPPYFPKPRWMNALSGVSEVALGLLLFPESTRSLAAWGIIMMLIVFFTVHIYMFQKRHTVFKNVSPIILVLRIPFQFVLIYLAYIYT